VEIRSHLKHREDSGTSLETPEKDRNSLETPTSIDVNNSPEEPRGGGEGKAVPWEAAM
jgi:hypothetical protein